MRGKWNLGTATVGIALAACSAHSSAEVGIGATVRSDVASFYIPWQVTPGFRLEAEISRFEDEIEQEQVFFRTIGLDPAQPAITYGSQPLADNSSELTEYGIGGFWTSELRDGWLLLLGMRVNYAKSENKVGSTTISGDSELSGIEWAPSIGVEYELLNNIHLALEYSFYNRELDGESTTWSTGPADSVNLSRADVKTEASGTRSRIVLRYFF